MSDHIRIGIIGAGGICRSRHLPNLARIEGVEVVAVCNRTRESGSAVASEFDVPEVMDDWPAMVARDDLDAILIGTWPYMHRELSIASLQAGKHVFCQARMACNLAEARAMVQCAEAHPGLVNMICPPPHRMPFEPFIKQTIIDGTLGTITAVQLTSTGAANLDEHSYTWREDAALSGKQALAMGIYAETLNAWLGPYASLSAWTSTPLSTKHVDGEPIAVEIPQVLMVQGLLPHDVLCTELHHGLVADETTPVNEIIIWGTQGTLRHRFTTEQIELAKRGEPLQPVDVPAEQRNPWRAELDFVEAVRAAKAGGTWQVSPDFAEGLLYMQKVEAVHLAAETGRSVEPGEL